MHCLLAILLFGQDIKRNKQKSISLNHFEKTTSNTAANMRKTHNRDQSHVLFPCKLICTYTILLTFNQVCTISSFMPSMNYNHHNSVQYSVSGRRYLSTVSTPAVRTSTSATTILQLSPYQEENEKEEETGRNDNRSRVNNGSNSQEQRESEFNSIEPREKSPQHEKRIMDEMHSQSIFVPYGNELWELRSTLLHLSKQLIHIMAQSHTSESSDSEQFVASEQEIREMIREVESKDAEHAYALEKENMEKALKEERLDDAKIHKEKALVARSALPHFNLHGLWVGK